MIFLPFGERFSFLIVNRLKRDDWWAIIRKYPTSLIGEDWMFSSNTDSLDYQSFKGASWTLVSGLYLGIPLRA